MDVLRFDESRTQRFVAGEVCHEAQLDLTVIRGEQHVLLVARNESTTDTASQLAADRDVLQIRVRGRETPGCRRGLIERGPQAPVACIYQLRYDVDVGVLEFGNFAPLQHQRADRILARQTRQHLDAGSPPRFGFLSPGNLEFAEEYFPELLGRADVEDLAGKIVDSLLQACHGVIDFFTDDAQLA